MSLLENSAIGRKAAFGSASGGSAGDSETTLAHNANTEGENKKVTTPSADTEYDKDGGFSGWMAVLGWYV